MKYENESKIKIDQLIDLWRNKPIFTCRWHNNICKSKDILGKQKLKESVSGVPALKYKVKRVPQEGSRDSGRNKNGMRNIWVNIVNVNLIKQW